ncbi:MAG: hypothetical protein JO301_09035 [Chitinophagaceae bacterium]|nr:hypothetical protein [Chitinophagaceae bacterium]
MFSTKNFSWKKWITLSLFVFVFTWLLAYFLRLTNENKHELLTVPSLARRSVTALLVGFFISFIRTEPKQ